MERDIVKKVDECNVLGRFSLAGLRFQTEEVSAALEIRTFFRAKVNHPRTGKIERLYGRCDIVLMNTTPGTIPIITRSIAMHKSISMSEGLVGLSAFALSEYNITPQQHYSTVNPVRSVEKIITFSGPFQRDGQAMELSIHRKLSRDEIARSLARINLLNEFFSDLGRRFESGVETLIPLFDGLQVGFRKIDFKTTGTVFVFEQDGARCEFVSVSVGEMTDLRDGLGHILNL